MIDVFIKTNSPIKDVQTSLSGFAVGTLVQVRNGGATELWNCTPAGGEKVDQGMSIFEKLLPEHIEFFGYVNFYGYTEPVNAVSLKLTQNESKEWLTSMERHRYLIEDGIGCSVDMKINDRTVTCAVATFALSTFKQHVISPGTELNNKILAWAGEMLKAGADAIEVCIPLSKK
jgi:hypothetical protein